MRDDHFDFIRGHVESENPGKGRGHDRDFQDSRPGKFLGHNRDDHDCPDALVFEPGTVVIFEDLDGDGDLDDPVETDVLVPGGAIAGAVLFDDCGCPTGNVFAA